MHRPNPTRREFLWQSGGGLGGIALAHLLASEGAIAGDGKAGLKGLHNPARATRVVQLFMSGAASQCDTFDYKPDADQTARPAVRPGREGRAVPEQPRRGDEKPLGMVADAGESGKFISDLLPHLGGCADEMAFVHSMVAKSNVHGPATFQQATGFVAPGFPAMGAWVSYGLGSLEREPADVRRPPRLARIRRRTDRQTGDRGSSPPPIKGPPFVRARTPPIFDLFPPKDSLRRVDDLARRPNARRSPCSARLNREHQATTDARRRFSARCPDRLV